MVVPLLSEFLAERPTPTSRQVSSGGPPPQLPRLPGVCPAGWAGGGDASGPAVSPSSPAGVSPVRVVAREPGSWSPASVERLASKRDDKRPLGSCDSPVRSMKRSLPSRERRKREPSPVPLGEGHGRREEPGSEASRNPPG